MSDYMIPYFPCHTQAVEIAITPSTEALLSGAKQETRDGYIINKLKSGCKM